MLGSTFDGSYEPVKEIADALDKLQADTGLNIALHVDAASGGFIAPFLQPELEWDFRIPRVCSINASGHKYGLVYPGVGWAIWRDKAALPEDLIFNVNYLGGNMPTFALNFSRPGSEVVAQYFMFTSLGREGYRVSTRHPGRRDRHLLRDRRARPLPAPVRRQRATGIRLQGQESQELHRLRGLRAAAPERLAGAGLHVPGEPRGLNVLRVVVRAGMNARDGRSADRSLAQQTEFLESLDRPMPGEGRKAFAHT